MVVALLILGSMLIYNQLNKEIYIPYQESSSVKYSVKIPKDAPFYSDYLEEFGQYADANGDLWIPSNFAYPTTASTIIKADLNYQLNMGTPDVDYAYTYRIYAQPEVVDSLSKNKFPMPKSVIEESKAPITQSSNNVLNIKKAIEIDYHSYNELVKDFENMLGVKNATKSLNITMEVEVIGSSEVFENNAENTHTIKIVIPLSENAFNVKYTSSSGQNGDCKILARKNAGNLNVFRTMAMVFGGVELLLLLAFVAFVLLTRNHDVNYSNKVKKLHSSYRSFIQRVVNGFDTTGYQMLEIASFKEMLAIRDTIQSPILMSENTDQTRTQFFIPTNTKVLYIFEIKVDNYDELYGAHPEWVDDSIINLDPIEPETVVEEIEPIVENASVAEPQQDNKLIDELYKEIEKLRGEIEATRKLADKPPVVIIREQVTVPVSEAKAQEKVEEAPVVAEEAPTVEEPEIIEEAPTVEEITSVEEPEVVEEATVPERIDLEHVLNDLEYDDEHGYFIDEKGNPLKIQVRRSFTANIIQSDPATVKYYYSELKNYALSFKGVKARMSWRYEAFKKGADQLLRMKIRGKSVCLYCALDPDQFDKNRYFQETLDSKMFSSVPMLVKIKSERGLKRAFELIDAVMEKFSVVKNPKAKSVDYVLEYPFEKTKALVEKGLIKILDNEYVIVEPKEHKTVAPVVEEPVIEAPEELGATEAIEETAEAGNDDIIFDIEFNEDGEIVIPEGKKLNIQCKRSFAANLMQSDPETVKSYYNDLKNYILSFKGVKARSAWRYESFKKGRNQLFRMRIKGKSLCLYCALDSSELDGARYFHELVEAKDYAEVSTMVRIKSARGLKRAIELVDMVMTRFEIPTDPKAKTVDYLAAYPFRKTAELIQSGLVKVTGDYKIKEVKAPKSKKTKITK